MALRRAHTRELVRRRLRLERRAAGGALALRRRVRQLRPRAEHPRQLQRGEGAHVDARRHVRAVQPAAGGGVRGALAACLLLGLRRVPDARRWGAGAAAAPSAAFLCRAGTQCCRRLPVRAAARADGAAVRAPAQAPPRAAALRRMLGRVARAWLCGHARLGLGLGLGLG